MEPSRTFVITNDMRIIVKNIHLNTIIEIVDIGNNKSITIGVDKWNEFKQSIQHIDEEFYRRFKYQYSNL